MIGQRISVYAMGLFPALTCMAVGAQSGCGELAGDIENISKHPETFNFYLENDLFSNTDRGYTSGVRVSWVSASLQDYAKDPCLPHWVRKINRYISRIHPAPYESRNMVITFGQQMFTPEDPARRDVIDSDRPYAGWLFLGLGYNARTRSMLDSIELDVGMIGPAALAHQSQDAIHGITRSPHFQGWDNQLHDEPGIQLVYERKHRLLQDLAPRHVDVISHYGASIGNVATYANIGAELRIGNSVPFDFGSSTLRPAGDNNAPRYAGQEYRPPGWHVFFSLDGRYVLRNIFLDGNTFRESHSVDKRPFVADLAVGFAWRWAGGKISFARYFRTREFYGQRKRNSYGSLTLSLDY